MKLSLEHELVSRGLVSLDTLADAKMTAAAAQEPLLETLLDMRAVGEDQLLDLFHQKLGFPAVDDTYFDKLEAATLALIPRELAVKHRVLPLYQSGDKLFVAAVDPLSTALPEVAQATGLQLIVCVAKPTGILRALSLRYQAPALLRRGAKVKSKAITVPDAVAPPPAPPRPSPAPAAAAKPQAKPPATQASAQSGTPVGAPEQPPRQKRPAEIVQEPPPAEPKADAAANKKVDASLTELFRRTEPSVNERPAPSRLPGPDEYAQAKLELEHASERDKVGRVLTLFVARYFPRVVLLAHKQGMLFGWQSVGTAVNTARLRGLIVPLHLPSVFQHIVQNRTYHIGKIEPNMINSAFLAAIGDEASGHAIIVPIAVERRVATVLYADMAGGGPPSTDLSLVYRLCEDAGAALSEMIRKQRGG